MRTVEQILKDLNFCGCGNSDTAYEVLHEVLSFHDRAGGEKENWEKKHEDQKLFQDRVGEGVFYLLLYFIDAANLTEHGGSVGGGWLNEDGKTLLKFLDENGFDSHDWELKEDENIIPKNWRKKKRKK